METSSSSSSSIIIMGGGVEPTTVNDAPYSSLNSAVLQAPVLQLNGEQQAMGLELVHHVSSLLCLMSSQSTAFEALRSEFLAEVKSARSGSAAPPAGLAKFQHKASHNQRLEELRNLQDRLSKEKAEWQRERSQQEEHISEQRKQLLKLQEQVSHPPSYTLIDPSKIPHKMPIECP